MKREDYKQEKDNEIEGQINYDITTYGAFGFNNDWKGLNFDCYALSDPGNKETRADTARNFLQKGFANVLPELDYDIIRPNWVDKSGAEIEKEKQPSIDEGLAAIFNDEMGIGGFRFSPNATLEQKITEHAKIVTSFVETSQNPDLTTDEIRRQYMIGTLEKDSERQPYMYSNDETGRVIDPKEVLDILGIQESYEKEKTHREVFNRRFPDHALREL